MADDSAWAALIARADADPSTKAEIIDYGAVLGWHSAAAMDDANKEIARLRAVIDELAAHAEHCGVDEDILDLWSRGKCIGGPDTSLGTSTPLTCAAIVARMREAK